MGYVFSYYYSIIMFTTFILCPMDYSHSIVEGGFDDMS